MKLMRLQLKLLREGVHKLTVHGQTPSQNKVPWKHVADYIYDNGGSYHFGNATCRKKWDEIQEAEVLERARSR